MSALTVAFVGAMTYSCPWLVPVLQEHLVDQEGSCFRTCTWRTLNDGRKPKYALLGLIINSAIIFN